MQNKPNFLNNQRNINPVMTKIYEHKMPLDQLEKQTQFKPNLRKAKMNVNSVKTKEYVNKPSFCPLAKQSQFKTNQTQFSRRPK